MKIDLPADIDEKRHPRNIGRGNYTEERREIFAGLTLENIVDQIKKRRLDGG